MITSYTPKSLDRVAVNTVPFNSGDIRDWQWRITLDNGGASLEVLWKLESSGEWLSKTIPLARLPEYM